MSCNLSKGIVKPKLFRDRAYGPDGSRRRRNTHVPQTDFNGSNRVPLPRTETPRIRDQRFPEHDSREAVEWIADEKLRAEIILTSGNNAICFQNEIGNDQGMSQEGVPSAHKEARFVHIQRCA